MGLLSSLEENRNLFLKYSAGKAFDPYSMSGTSLRALFDEIVHNVRWLN